MKKQSSLRSTNSHWLVKDFDPNEFICMASHELKTPLTALQLQVEMAKKSIEKNLSGMSPEKINSIINRTHQDISRITKLIDDMLDVSRINCEKFIMNFEFFELEDFFENLITRSFAENERKRIICHINAPELVKWDRLRVEQVLVSLLNRTLKCAVNSPVEFNVQTGGGLAWIEIKDADSHPMNREKNETKDGFNLELYICNEIIRQHSGKLTFENKCEEGIRFQIQLHLRT